MSLFNSLKDILTNAIVAQIADLTQEKPEQIQKAFDVSTVGLVGSLLKRVSSETGMKLVHDQISKTIFDSSDLANKLKNSDGLAQLSASGDKILNTILPSVKSPVVGLVSKATGMRNSKATLLCTFNMLLITSALRNQIQAENLNPQSLASYLGDQRNDLLEVSPTDSNNIIEATGIGHLLNNFSVPQNTNNPDTTPADSTSVAKADLPVPFLNGNNYEKSTTDYGPIFKWIGAGLAAVLVAGGLYFWNNYQNTTTDSSEDSTAAIQNEARVIVEPSTSTEPDGIKTDTIASQKPLIATAATATNVMQVYLADTTKAKGRTLRFDNVDFENNDVTTKPEASAAISELIATLKKYPTAEVKFIVYANDAVLPLTNKMLSIKRAFALKNQMITGGISFVRIDTEGRGSGMEQKTNPSPKPLREVYVKFIKK
jgi:outer membrane protein OmpA-like peptidoglycan-associated protein